MRSNFRDSNAYADTYRVPRTTVPTHQRRLNAPTSQSLIGHTDVFASRHQPTYQAALQNKLIGLQELEKIEDIKLALRTRQENGTPLPLHVLRDNDLRRTRIYLQLDEAHNLPKKLQKKYNTENDITAGIHLILPDKALPAGGLEHNKESLKTWLGVSMPLIAWLGLSNDYADFQLFTNPKRRMTT